jgi:hypothetical protein
MTVKPAKFIQVEEASTSTTRLRTPRTSPHLLNCTGARPVAVGHGGILSLPESMFNLDPVT